jgi:CheY-like chemotaxis protein
MNVLVVDDVKDNVDLFSLLFRSLCTVISFCNPEECVKWYEETHEELALAIIDYSMPEMSGIELIEKLRNAACKCKIIIYTADKNLNFSKVPENLNIFDIVYKPDTKTLKDYVKLACS